MEPTIIKSGKSEVLASGTVIAYNRNPIKITIGPADDRVNFIFDLYKDDKDNKELKVDIKPLNDHTLEFIFTNFNNPLGSGNLEPIRVGILEGRDLFISYRVYELQGGDKTFNYTLYLVDREEESE